MKTYKISALFIIATLFAPISSGELLQGNSITTGGTLYSDDGLFYLIVQGDGNVVIYGCRGFVAVWATGTNNSTAQRSLLMQSDGNLVLVENGVTVWQSGTDNRSRGPFILNMTNNGYLSIVGGNGQIWTSNSAYTTPCQLCAYVHDGKYAGTGNQIKLAYYDFNTNYYSECYLNGTKNRATTYCCTPVAATIDRTTSFGTGKRYVKIQIYGDDAADIGTLSVFGKQLENFYNKDLRFLGGLGQIVALFSDSRGYTYFEISTGDGVYPVVVADVDNYYSRNGYTCYWCYSFSS
jgi:hypothetical protein